VVDLGLASPRKEILSAVLVSDIAVFVLKRDVKLQLTNSAVLPEAQIQLCTFHVLKAARKEIVKSVPKQSHRQVYSIVHSLVYSRKAMQFDDSWKKLEAYPAFAHYMQTNWLPTKAWWVHYERACHMNLGNGTSNRIESQFGKITQVVCRKRRLNECISLLLTVVHSGDVSCSSLLVCIRLHIAMVS